ncbi:MAG: hypothetical protein P4M11_10140 [Candidatus Pacebacteria bacterium]|nr:hypothetical protein [Candidatus Paceibacterota bacterium]
MPTPHPTKDRVKTLRRHHRVNNHQTADRKTSPRHHGRNKRCLTPLEISTPRDQGKQQRKIPQGFVSQATSTRNGSGLPTIFAAKGKMYDTVNFYTEAEKACRKRRAASLIRRGLARPSKEVLGAKTNLAALLDRRRMLNDSALSEKLESASMMMERMKEIALSTGGDGKRWVRFGPAN